METINRIRQLLLELENHEYVHKNGLERIMNNLRHNVNKLGLELELAYEEDRSL